MFPEPALDCLPPDPVGRVGTSFASQLWGSVTISEPYPSPNGSPQGTFLVPLGPAALRTLALLMFPALTPVGDSQAQLQPTLPSGCFSGNLKQEDRCSRLKESGAEVFRGHHPRPFPEM